MIGEEGIPLDVIQAALAGVGQAGGGWGYMLCRVQA